VSGYPLLYLTLASTRNRIRARLRRLREPRYLIASVLGVGYFWLVVFRRGGRNTSAGMAGMADVTLAVQVGATLMLFAGAAVAWIWPRSGRPALPFTRAEVQHLFTAPIARHHLIRYRVLRSQISAAVVGGIITLLFRPMGVAEGLSNFLGLSLVLATINLHLTGVSLSRLSGSARGWIPRLVAAGAVAIVAVTAAMHWSMLTALAARRGDLVGELSRLTTSGVAGAVLWPFRALANVVLAQSPEAFLVAAPWAIALLLLNYMWVLRTDVPFEEASAELAVKLDDIRRRGPEALRSPPRAKKPPFTLSPHGRPETAILWKNLISMSRVLSWTMLVRVAPLIVFISMAFATGRRSSATILAVAALFIAALTVVLGPQMTRNDLRQDLAALGVLKTWPIRGAALVRGEVLAPAIVLIAIASIALVTAAVVSTKTSLPAPITNRWSWLVAALLVAPGFVLTQLLAQNGLAVMFPSWVSIGRRGGLDAMGNQMLILVAVVLAVLAAVLPAAIVAGIGTGIIYLMTGTFPVVVAGVLAGGTLLVEAFIAAEIVGAFLDRSDISALDAQES
jgi:ABC-2 type transport system permease protein